MRPRLIPLPSTCELDLYIYYARCGAMWVGSMYVHT